MAHTELTSIKLHYGGYHEVVFETWDALSNPIDLSDASVDFAIAFGRLAGGEPSVVIMKADTDNVSIDGHRAIIKMMAEQFFDGALTPRLFGYWYTYWVKYDGKEPEVAGEGPVDILPSLVVQFENDE